MISTNIFNIAKSHADALQDSVGKVIAPAGRSTLSALVDISYVGSLPENETVQFADVLAAATDDSVDGPSSHTVALGNRIDALIPVVASHIDFIQNKVCPDVIKFEKDLYAAVDRIDSQNPVGMFDIVQTNAPEVLDDEGFVDLIEHFADGNLPTPTVLASLPAQSVEQLTEIMTVSSGALNQQIGNWLAEMGDAWILDVWNHFFAGLNTAPTGALVGPMYTNFASIQNLPTFERLNTSLALFLLSRGLLDSPLDDSGVSLSVWQSSMDSISRYAGAQVKAAQFHLDMVQKQQTVILGISNGGKRISVFTPAYALYLEQGGCIEEILGAALSEGSSSYSLETLKQEGTRYAEIWKNYQAIGQSVLNSRAVDTLRAEAKALFASMSSISDSDEDLALQAVYGKAYALEQKANALIDSLDLRSLRDARELALCLVAGIRYAHTPAKQFLCDMHEAQQAGCENPKEAALIAAANYVSDALANELSLVTM